MSVLHDDESPKPVSRKAPVGLGTAGRRLWREVVNEYELRVDEALVLTSACRLVDQLQRLEAELESADTIVRGSTGQVRPNGLFGEIRLGYVALRTLLTSLGLEDAGEGDEGHARSHAGRRLVRLRWGSGGRH